MRNAQWWRFYNSFSLASLSLDTRRSRCHSFGRWIADGFRHRMTVVPCTRRRPRVSGCLSLLEVPTVARSRRGLKSGTVQRMLRLAPEAEERASAREERGVRDMEGGERGKRWREKEREWGWRKRDVREDSLVENGGTRSSISLPLSLFLSLSISQYLYLCSMKKVRRMGYRRVVELSWGVRSFDATSCW